MHLKNFDPYNFSKKKIDGVNVYYKNLPWAPCINIYLVFNTGSFSDPKGKEGLSHFLEHMIFDGSPKFKDKKSVREWSKKYALNSWNASTGFYETTYHLKCLPKNYRNVLVGIKDMVFSPFILKEEVEHERKVITQESWRRFKNEKFLSYTKEVADILFHGHNFSRMQSPLGWPETILKITQEDLRQWHSEKYMKGNFFVVLSGAVEDKHIKHIDSLFKDININKSEEYNKNEVPKTKVNRIIKTSNEIGDPKEQVEITIYRALNPLSRNEISVASLFRTLIGDLLNEKLRFEKGLCYGVTTKAGFYNDFSEIYMNINTEEKNIEIVEKEFWNTISEIENGLYKEKFELLKIVTIDQIESRETISERITEGTIGDISRFGKPISQTMELRYLKKVKYEDLVYFSKKTFDSKLTFTEIILPSK